MGGPFDFIGDIAKGVGLEQQGRAQYKAGQAYQRGQQQRINSLNWEPEYASEHAPTYQRSQSPVARAYLESMLTGSNPDTTFSGQHGSAPIRAQQAASFKQTYGSMEDLQRRSDAMQNDTPWQVKPITRVVKDQAVVNAVGPRARYTAIGFTPEEADRLAKHNIEVVDGKVMPHGLTGGVGAITGLTPDQFRKYVRDPEW